MRNTCIRLHIAIPSHLSETTIPWLLASQASSCDRNVVNNYYFTCKKTLGCSFAKNYTETIISADGRRERRQAGRVKVRNTKKYVYCWYISLCLLGDHTSPDTAALTLYLQFQILYNLCFLQRQILMKKLLLLRIVRRRMMRILVSMRKLMRKLPKKKRRNMVGILFFFHSNAVYLPLQFATDQLDLCIMITL